VQAREAAERQPIALEMENRVVAPESAYNLLHSFDDPDYGFHFPEIRLLTWEKASGTVSARLHHSLTMLRSAKVKRHARVESI
jgi:hypothetical protein